MTHLICSTTIREITLKVWRWDKASACLLLMIHAKTSLLENRQSIMFLKRVQTLLKHLSFKLLPPQRTTADYWSTTLSRTRWDRKTINAVKTKETFSNLISPHVPDVGEQEEQLGLPPRLLLSRASWLTDVVYESICDGVQHALHRHVVMEGLHCAGAEREGTWRRKNMIFFS